MVFAQWTTSTRKISLKFTENIPWLNTDIIVHAARLIFWDDG